MQANDINELESLISICYDKAQNTTLIRRCFSSIFFEIILIIAHNFLNFKDEIFDKRNNVFHGISESKFITVLGKILGNNVKTGKISSEEADNFLKFMRILLQLRTLVDHFGGFKEELLNLGLTYISIYDPSISSSKVIDVINLLPDNLSREALINVLKETEKYLVLLSKL